MIVSLSTGSVHKVAENILEQVHFIEREFSGLIDGVELCFIEKKDFDAFEFDKKSINFLNTLEFNTLHAPVKEMNYGKNNETNRNFGKIKELSEQVEFEYVTFHPNHVSDFSILPDCGLNVCIENMPDGEKRKGWQYPNDFQEFFKKWSQFGFCFDVNHAIANAVNPEEFISSLGDKIKYVHLNATKPGNANHDLLVESDKETLEKIKPVFSLQKPLVIEVKIDKEKTPLIKKEIELIRTLGKNV